MGGVLFSSRSSEPVPAHRIEDPPTSPPRQPTGRRWGERRTHWRTRCHPGRVAQHSEAARHITSSGAPAADVTPSAATGAAVEPLRALPCNWGFSGPASGMAGDRGGDLVGVQRTQRSEENETPARSSSGRVHVPVKETSPRPPGTGTGRCPHPRRHSRPVRIA